MLHNVNLFPWREEQRVAHQRRFIQLLILGLVLAGIGVWLAGKFVISQQQIQHIRLGLLEQHNRQLDQQLRSLRGVEKEYQALLARLEVVESLQQQRNKTTQLMHLMTEQIPDGVYIDKITLKKATVEVSGISDTTAHLANMLDQLEQSAQVSALTMHSIVAGSQRFNKQFQSFKVSFDFNPQPTKGLESNQGALNHG